MQFSWNSDAKRWSGKSPDHTLSRDTETKTIKVTVRLLVPPAWSEADDTLLRDHVLEREVRDEWRPDITVRGPKTDVQQLNEKEVDAYVLLTEDNRKPVDSWLPGKVVVRFPKHLQIRLVGEVPDVHFRFVPRNAAGVP